MIIPQKKLIVLLACGMAASFVCIFFQKLLYFVIIYDFVLTCITIFEICNIPQRSKINIERFHEKYLSLGAENKITISIQNLSPQSVRVILRDGYPITSYSKSDTIMCDIAPFSEKKVHYFIVPLKKGTCHFEFVHFRVLSKWEIVARQYKTMLCTSAIVLPNIIELKKYLRMHAYNRLSEMGYRARERGGETEFDFLRDYVPGDDYKHIHWKATAKRRFPITTIYEKEHNRNVMALLDCGRMMTTQYGILNKFDYAVNATLLLAAAAKIRKDKFGVAVFSDTIKEFIVPRRGSSLFSEILPPLARAEAKYVNTNYTQLLPLLQKYLRKSSILFVFSELYHRAIADELFLMLSNLARSHRVYFISFEEIEEEPEITTHEGIAQWILQKNFEIEKEILMGELTRKGVHALQVHADNIIQKVVNAYLSS
ncbi:MAG: DUF58 domain-containing protein [Spirochaetes bacterium]|nr:DUF58 domain-containing protein [Spirochaetota bacterium]